MRSTTERPSVRASVVFVAGLLVGVTASVLVVVAWPRVASRAPTSLDAEVGSAVPAREPEAREWTEIEPTRCETDRTRLRSALLELMLPRSNDRFDAAGLMETGMTADEAARLEARFQESRREFAEIRDAALESGEITSPAFYRSVGSLVGRLRQELGDDGYDRMLFGAGMRNRVVVRSVPPREIRKLPLQPGDVIWRYDGQRIFSLRELEALASTRRAAPARLEVLRRGRLSTFAIPRGDLSMVLAMEKQRP